MINSVPLESPHPPFFPFSQIAPCHHIKRRGYSTWRQHGTNDWLLKHTIAGKGRIGFEGGEIIVQAGDAVLFRPGTLHDYGVEPSLELWDIIWTHFRPRPGWLELMNWIEVAPGLMLMQISNRQAARKIEIQLKEMNRLARRTTPKREAFALNALEKALLMYDEYNSEAISNNIDPRITAVLEHLRSNLQNKFSLPELAKISQLSASRLYHLFSSEIGQPPYEYLEFMRLDQAKYLLETTRSKIHEIAELVGFEDALNFSRRFKHRVGLSPRGYRKNLSDISELTVIDRD
jgi:AraC family transcriptional regulator, arabinose operon regulatory protein